MKLFGKAITNSEGEEVTTLTLPSYRLKVLNDPDPENFKEGTYCKAIYQADGEFYPCVIDKIEG